MALKSDRHELMTDISFFLNETKDRGFVAVLSTGGSGAAMDQSAALLTFAANASGQKPMGLLLNDMVNIDQTRQHINWHKDEVQKGGKVTVLQQGWVVTDSVYPNQSPTAGDLAYIAQSGYISNDDSVTSDSADSDGSTRVIGRFLSTKDEDGYAKVYIDLPNTNV